MNAVDTNILIYARDPRDPRKQAIAEDLISSMIDGVLLWQVACEYLAASRKLEKFGYDREQAIADLADMRDAWQTILPSWSVMDDALRLLKKYQFIVLGCELNCSLPRSGRNPLVFRGLRHFIASGRLGDCESLLSNRLKRQEQPHP